MKKVLINECFNEKPNSSALGAYNSAIDSFNSTPKEGNFQFQKHKGGIYKRNNSTGKVTFEKKAPEIR